MSELGGLFFFGTIGSVSAMHLKVYSMGTLFQDLSQDLFFELWVGADYPLVSSRPASASVAEINKRQKEGSLRRR